MTTLRHQLDLALASLRVHGMTDAVRVVQEFTEQMRTALEGPTYATAREAIEAALRRICPDVRYALAEAVDLVLSNLAEVQPAATGRVPEWEQIRRAFYDMTNGIAAVRKDRYNQDEWRALVGSVETLRLALYAYRDRPAADRDGEAMAVLRECLDELVDEASDEHDSTHDLRKRIRALIAATPAPQPAAPVEGPALAEARHELDLLQAVYGGWHARTPREVEIATALAETAPQDRDSPDNAISDLLTIIDGLRGIIWKQPAAPVEVSEEMVEAAAKAWVAVEVGPDWWEMLGFTVKDRCRLCARAALIAALDRQRGGK